MAGRRNGRVERERNGRGENAEDIDSPSANTEANSTTGGCLLDQIQKEALRLLLVPQKAIVAERHRPRTDAWPLDAGVVEAPDSTVSHQSGLSQKNVSLLGLLIVDRVCDLEGGASERFGRARLEQRNRRSTDGDVELERERLFVAGAPGAEPDFLNRFLRFDRRREVAGLEVRGLLVKRQDLTTFRQAVEPQYQIAFLTGPHDDEFLIALFLELDLDLSSGQRGLLGQFRDGNRRLLGVDREEERDGSADFRKGARGQPFLFQLLIVFGLHRGPHSVGGLRSENRT